MPYFTVYEGYLASIATPISELYSLKSIELIADNLPSAIADGKDESARSNIALTSTLGGMVESTSSCISGHSLAHA